MKKTGIPFNQLLAFSFGANNEAFIHRDIDPLWLKNSLKLNQKTQLDKISYQLSQLKRLMDGEDIDSIW